MNFDYFYNRQSEMYNFIRLPMVLMEDEIFESISIEAKVLYSYMLNRMGLSCKNGWIDEDGKVFIYYTIESIKEQFNCASEKANKLIAELDIKSGIGLIEKKRQGLGKPNRIYVKDFMSIFNNMELKNQEVRKSEGNYNNISNNELRNNDFSKGQKPYGIYKNIFFTDEDYKDLTNELGSRINEYIDRLSSYMKANNRVYQDHKATIINWYLNDQAKNINDNATRKMNYDIGESL
ncbi:Replication initiator protein A (RepA) N-terminus [Anaerococcus octavius]|uniref:Replication initiator protein A (RepA) N-terminus n=1 Tax=Anaerococcus octavius TaxID=54007 RepID=A0A380WTK4_9FIRM|nr:replication initiator protein A [Anaerococcus octavius]SUU92371.1 Replication initiator protein A (RepA) N-terminus [Anaerococcus octavius]